MRRLLPSPVLSVGLFVLWILLMQSVSAGTLLLGVLLAVFWPLVTARLRPAQTRLRRPGVLIRLVGRVVGDMLRSNFEVGWLILTRGAKPGRSGFVQIPLDLRDASGLAALAIIVTFIPGTAWAQLSADRRVLLLHVLDVVPDEASVVRLIKQRYERSLIEIFE